MTAKRTIASLALLVATTVPLATPSPAAASRQIYEYRIEHPTYGDIGTYTNIVQQSGDATEVETRLAIAVKLVGVVVYREEAQRTEHWKGDRLVGFESVTNTNGKMLEIRGEAKGDNFLITTPTGTATAPANIHPSNPWSAKVLASDVMMSTKTGRIFNVKVSTEDQTISIGGAPMKLHRYEIDGIKRQFVWLNDGGVPVAFRTEEDGTQIDFRLADLTAGSQNWRTLVDSSR